MNVGDIGQPYRPLVIPAKKNWPESPDLQSFVVYRMNAVHEERDVDRIPAFAFEL